MTVGDKPTAPVIVEPLFQRVIVCDPSARWLGAIRGGVDEVQRRAVVPALDFADAVNQAKNANQAIVVMHVSGDNPNRAIEQLRSIRLSGHVLVFAVGEPGLWSWRLALVEAGSARVFTGMLQLDSLLESARHFFAVQPPVRFSWQEQIRGRMPWPGWATEKAPVSKTGTP